MNRARLMLCGVAIGLWAGLVQGAELSGPELTPTDTAAPSQGRWEPRSDHSRTSRLTESPRLAAAWESEPTLSSVRAVSVQTPAKSDSPAITPLPDAAASGTAKASASPVAPEAVPIGPTAPSAARSRSGPRGMIVPDDDSYYLDSQGSIPNAQGAAGSPEAGESYDARPFSLYGDEGCAETADCGPCRPLPLLSFWGGVHGFKGPTDQGRNGNFGFQEGVGWSSLFRNSGIGYQIGMNATQSNFSGNQTTGEFNDSERDQVFVTAGLFHRAVCGGVQWGVAYDNLRDGYLENFQLQQFRSEASYVFEGGGEFGFWGAFGIDSDDLQYGHVQATDVYAFFLRKTVESGGQGRLWLGWTPQGALVGGDLRIPLGASFALENSFNYLISQGNDTDDYLGDQRHEAWSLGANLVWYLGRNPCLHQSPARALMPVADNSYFLINTDP